jgi:hypothetical protein
MKELILTQHGTEAPNTYTDGSAPIDGIFATNWIHAVFSGYTSFSWGLWSDHRLLWVDLDMNEILGLKETPLWKPHATRLKCEDPRLVIRFNYRRIKHMEENNL